MKTLTKEIIIINEGTIQFPILPNGSGWKTTEKEKLSVIESGAGKVMFSKIIKAIDSAKELVCLQSFLIQDTAIIDVLIKAVKDRKVKVIVLSSAEARLKETIEEEQDFIKSNYIQLLDSKFKNHFVHRSADNFHAKYILIDPTKKPKGFLCTNNFTENGFTKNPELAVELNKEQCEELFKVFVYHFWEHSTDEQSATNEFAKVRPLHKFSLPKLETILLTSPNGKSSSLSKSLLASVNKAKQTISLSTFSLDKNTELVKAVIAKAKQNISVTLFCRPIEKQFNEHLKDLLEAGAQIYFHPFTHAKSIIIDGKVGFVFTANLITNGLESGFEVGVKLNAEQTIDLVSIHQNWLENFPSKAIKVANVKDLKEIEFFKDGKLMKKVLGEVKKELKQKAVTVADLFSFFNKKYIFNNDSIKSLTLKLLAEIDDLPTGYKVNGNQIFEVSEVEEVKGKKSKFVVITDKFSINDLNAIQEWKDLGIYAKK